MQPQTLREVAGLGTAPARLQDSALIMVDLQNTYREGVMRLAGVEEALLQARWVLERARELGRPLVVESCRPSMCRRRAWPRRVTSLR